ncbi:Aste57867_17029 [Aphanomyces stellatus]|uniref:Aste57867_17029 protein n=1 Tax=Aphanomyces stellatus TaxID=120398 RepID=A0A485L8C2_9STRA|nr:hypothetical protein As57867_016971 [Aphanomyces stellatus]VFT93790.1 Aste57867_17029 [Aphanomyces stellatus]
MRWYRRARRKFVPVSSRLLACVAAMIVLVWEFMGSSANKQLLLGVTTDPAPTISYKSSHIADFLPTIVANPGAVRASLAALARPSDPFFLAYLDKDHPSGALQLFGNGCVQAGDIDYLYNASYVQPVLQRALAGYADTINLTNMYVLVDCSYEGRTESDTTVMKLHFVDKGVTSFTTFMLQTLSITRPQMQRLTSGGAAMFTTMPLSAMAVDAINHGFSFTQDAVYHTAIGFTFPYEPDNFDAVALDSGVPTEGQWHATVVATNEKFKFAGTTGIFRRSPEIQGSFNYFYWDMPPSPLEFASAIQFQGCKVFKDSWGWFRCFLGVGIGFNIGINTGVAVLVMINMYVNDGVFWVPDIYPSIQRRATVRAALLLADCFMNHWWYPYQWAVNQGSVRNHWGGTTGFNEISRADGCMAVLAITVYAATSLEVRAELVVVVGIYFACYEYRQALIKATGVYLARITPFIKANYFDNILPTPGGGAMDLWAYHENFANNYFLVANECTYLIVAAGAGVGYVCLLKVVASWQTRHHSHCLSTLRLVKWRHVKPIVKYFVKTRGSGKLVQEVVRAHWSVRSTLYMELSDEDTDNAQLERCAGRIVSRIYGFVAYTKDYAYEGGSVYVSPSGVWLLGFVIVNNQYVVGINHYIYVVLNALIQRTLFNVYGFALMPGDAPSTRKHRIVAQDIPLRDVWRVSLKKLR